MEHIVKNRSFKDRVFFSTLYALRSTLGSVFILSLVFPLCGFKFLSELQNEKANTLYKKGQLGKAKTEYARALKTDPSSSQIAYNLGNALFREGAFKDSQTVYQKAGLPVRQAGASGGRAPDPLFQAKANYNLGNSFYRQKGLPEAAEAYKRSLRLNPKDEDAKYNLELVLKQLEKEKKNDQKKDDQKKEDQKKNDQKKDQNQDGGGSQGQQQEQAPQKDQGSSGGDQGEDEENSPQGEEKKDQPGKEGEEKEQEEKAGQEGGKEDQKESPGSEEPKEGKPDESNGQSPSGASEEPKEEPKEEDKNGSGGGPEQPKTDAQLRAEQLLGALENQEQQVLKFQSGQNGPQARVRRVSEQDW